MQTPTFYEILATMRSRAFTTFDNDTKPYNLNLIGIRSSDLTPNIYNDELHVLWQYKGLWRHLVFPFTTDPGTYYLRNPMNVKGTIIMVPGQYKSAYVAGQHRGREAFRQAKPMRYWRDANRDNKLDPKGEIFEEVAYTNLHDQVGEDNKIDKASAGCQVVPYAADYDLLIHLRNRAVKWWGKYFTYTLLDEDWLIR